MGAFSSKKERDEVNLRFGATRVALYLTESEFWSLYSSFKRANRSGTGRLTYEEFIDYVDIEVDAFTQKLFNLYRGHEKGGGIPFKNFAILSWNICTGDMDSLSLMAFSVYDRDGDGLLDLNDVKSMFTEMFGKEYRELGPVRQFEASLCRCDMLGNPISAAVTIEKFIAIFARAESALFYCFTVQRALKTAIVGESFWNRQTRKIKLLVAEKKFSLEPILAILNEHRPPELQFAAYGERHFIPKNSITSVMGVPTRFTARSEEPSTPTGFKTPPRIDTRADGGGGTSPARYNSDVVASPSGVPLSFQTPTSQAMARATPGSAHNMKFDFETAHGSGRRTRI